MLALTTWLLTISFPLAPLFGWDLPRRIDVDCDSGRALQRVLNRPRRHGDIDIYLHGICRGNFVITADGVTLRGATRESGLAAPDGNPGFKPVLEVIDARATLRGLVVLGEEGGVHVHGWNAQVLLVDVDVSSPSGVGVISERGAHAQLLETTLRDGGIGLLVRSNATANLQRVTVTNQQTGVMVTERSLAAISDTTIENSREGGINVTQRSDVNILGGVFSENGQVHMSSADWSRITLLNDPVVGSATDATGFAMGVTRYATIVSYGTSDIYGHASALIGGAFQLGNTVLHGDLTARQFANAHVRNAEITGSVLCADGADVICSGTTTGGSLGCPSSTCGPATAQAIERAPTVSSGPLLEERAPELPPRLRPRP